ncbi:MAG TPA: hypothetical protein VKB09_12100 [Thermomicrobiales bacterium]|nr:hypothetical protein [Thermomicrobiales bacterium]
MDRKQLANATAAWVEAWMFGNARPQLVIESLRRLGAQYDTDTQAHAILEQGWRAIAGTPFGSVSEPVTV